MAYFAQLEISFILSHISIKILSYKQSIAGILFAHAFVKCYLKVEEKVSRKQMHFGYVKLEFICTELFQMYVSGFSKEVEEKALELLNWPRSSLPGT